MRDDGVMQKGGTAGAVPPFWYIRPGCVFFWKKVARFGICVCHTEEETMIPKSAEKGKLYADG